MAEKNGNYYWIKLKTDFFSEDSPIDFLLSQPNGSEYVVLYIKLCLATANTGGQLYQKIGEMIIPYNIEKIQRDMKFFSLDTVRVALEMYKQLGLVYKNENGVLAIANHSDMVGTESKWAQYKRKSRAVSKEPERKKLETDWTMSNGSPKNGLDNVQQEIRDKSIDIRDIDTRYTEPISKDNTSYQSINHIADRCDSIDTDRAASYMELIKQNLSYDDIMQYGSDDDKKMIETAYNIICDIVCVKRKSVTIGGTDFPWELVKARLLKINLSHVRYVELCMSERGPEEGIYNIRAYLLAALYNAPSTMDQYYAQRVKHDMYKFAGTYDN